MEEISNLRPANLACQIGCRVAAGRPCGTISAKRYQELHHRKVPG
jgi:hypothetical protein